MLRSRKRSKRSVTVRDSSPSREAIEEFLKVELAGSQVAVKRLHERAVAAGLLPEGEGPPVWRRKPWRSAARRLGVEHHQQDREWFWQMPAAEKVQVPEQIAQVPAGNDQVPTGMSVVLSQAPTQVRVIPDTLAAQDDIATAPDIPASDGQAASSDSPQTPAEDLVEARRRFAERMLRWFDSDECRAAMAEGRRQAEEIIRRAPKYAGLA
jgi:hypothetical protein